MSVRMLVVFAILFATARCTQRIDQQFWKDLAKEELDQALRVKLNTKTAKNVILFVGDGMGPNTVTATRIYKGGESNKLSFETFPHVGILKTYSANKMVPDSASTATALFCGVKVNHETIGVDATVSKNDCNSSLRPEARLRSLAALALDTGKSAGFVTTMRVTHATPGPIYAHSANRRWECEAKMPPNAKQCKDHARQLIEDWPGRDLHVIMGGGMQALVSNSTATAEDPLDTWGCIRQDRLNLIEKYKENMKMKGRNYTVVTNNSELGTLSVRDTDYLLGIFANGHLKYEHERDKGASGMPSLAQMVEAAIKVLRKNKSGYFLMVEGGNIDMAHHRGRAKVAIDEAVAFDAAVHSAAAMVGNDTLLVVTSDHTHTLAINGYPQRGDDILGIASKSSYDGINYTTLSYSTGGPGSYKYYVQSNENGLEAVRRDPSQEDTTSFQYEQVAGIRLVENSHGGGDVAIYAKGPYAHLFHNVHEQHYVFHAICFAAQLGVHAPVNSGSASYFAILFAVVIIFFAIWISGLRLYLQRLTGQCIANPIHEAPQWTLSLRRRREIGVANALGDNRL